MCCEILLTTDGPRDVAAFQSETAVLPRNLSKHREEGGSQRLMVT